MAGGRLATVGHGTRSTAELVDVLRAGGVTRLCDVRRFPGSRRNPQFSRDALARDLPAAGIAYEWWGEELGGRRSSGAGGTPSRHAGWRVDAFRAYADWMDGEAFRDGLTRLLDGPPLAAVMCAETLWWRCHRRLIADAAVVRGAEVVHLLGVGEAEPHRPAEFLRVGDDGWPVYDAGQPPLTPPPLCS